MRHWDRLMAIVMGGTSIEGTGGLQEWLDAAADMGADRSTEYKLYEDFYDGKRGAELRDRARHYLELSGVPFCENFCDVVVDTLAERLIVIGFSVGGMMGASDEVDSLLAQHAEHWWQENRMDGVQQTVHTGALLRGDEYVIVEWDAGASVPRFHRQHPHQVKVVYSVDEPGRIDFASKIWNTTRVGAQNPSGRSVRRLNVYFENRVEKWYRPDSGGKDGAWERWQDPADPGWPVWWTDTGLPEGEPIGVPVVHFRYRPTGDGNGRSRVRQVIPFQAELNKYLVDLSDLIDNHALPQDYVTGVSADNVEFKRVPGNLWQATSTTAEFGRLNASPTDNLLASIEAVLSRLARKMRTPMHLLTGGTPPSGESLKTAESGLVSQAKTCQTWFGNSWEDMIHIGLHLAVVFGTLDKPAGEVKIEAQWANAATRSDKDELETALLKRQLGVSKQTLLQELGYDSEVELERRLGETDEAAAAVAGLLNTGGG